MQAEGQQRVQPALDVLADAEDREHVRTHGPGQGLEDVLREVQQRLLRAHAQRVEVARPGHDHGQAHDHDHGRGTVSHYFT